MKEQKEGDTGITGRSEAWDSVRSAADGLVDIAAACVGALCVLRA